jgi:hypothetical protein
MRAFAQALRFFQILELSHPVVTVGLILITFASMVAIVVSPGQAAAFAWPVLMSQVLASSSGFAPPARRGHYDLPLTMGLGRSAIGLAHWCVSAWPGIAAWLALAVTELLVSPRPSRLIRLASVSTLILSSTLPWALTVPFPRLTGGLAIILGGMSISAIVPRDLHSQWVRLFDGAPIQVAVIASTASVVAMILALQFICRMDVRLEAQ